MTTAAATQDSFDTSLDDLALALAGGPEMPEEQRTAAAEAAKHLLRALAPQDSIQLMIAGQAVLFNALTIDAAREILNGLAVTLRIRARSNTTAMGRLVAKHLDTLIKLQGRLKPAAVKEESPEAPAVSAEPEPVQTSAPRLPGPNRATRRSKKLLAHKALRALRAAIAPVLADQARHQPLNSRPGHAVPARTDPSTTMAESSIARP